METLRSYVVIVATDCFDACHRRSTVGLRAACALVLTATLGAAPGVAATRSWVGGLAANDWATPGNWSAPSVPQAADTTLLNASNPAIITTTDAIASQMKLGSQVAKSGALQINAGAVFTTGTGSIGDVATGTGLVTVSGGRWSNSVSLAIGASGSGTMTIRQAGTVSNTAATIGNASTGIGTVTVTGPGSSWANSGGLVVGGSGQGTLQVTAGATLTSDGGTTGSIIGRNAGSNGEVTITGSGSSWAAKGSIHTGYSGTGKLVIADGAQVAAEVSGSFGNNNVGLNAGSNGTLRIESGGSLSGGSGTVGGAAGATGTATVTGQGSRWLNSGILNVGSTGTGTLLIEKGGYVTSDGGTVGSSIGRFGGSVGLVTLTDPDTLWSVKGSVHVGYEGKGTLIVSNGASVSAMGTPPYGNINVGLSNGSDGTLLVESGGKVSGLFGMIGGTVNASAANEGGARGRATVTGPGSSWVVGDTLGIGQSGDGSLTISDQATVSAAKAVNLGFGRVSKGVLLVDGGATLSGATATIGSSAGSTGIATVTGTGSAWNTADALTIGSSGAATLTLADGGEARAAIVTLAANGGAQGTLNIGAASGSVAQAAGTLAAARLNFGAGNGTLVFNHTGSDYRFATVMSGAGTINAENGRTVLTGDSTAFGGNTRIAAGATLQIGDGGTTGSLGGAIVDAGELVLDRSDDVAMANPLAGPGSLVKQGAGTLLIDGDVSGLTGPTLLAQGGLRVDGSLARSTVTARTGTSLSGAGTVGGVVAQSGSTVTPGTGGLATLGVAGSFHQLAGATYAVDVVQNSRRSDLISVGGTATIDAGAILDITARGRGDYTVNDDFTVLTAAGGVSGTYLLAGDTQISDFYRLEAVYDANNVYLRAMQIRNFADAALTPNQIATAGGIESLPDDSQLRDAVASLAADAEARRAFDQLSGEVHASIAGEMVEESRFIRDAVVGRLRCSSVERPPSEGEDCRHGRVWAQAYGARQTTAGDGNAAAVSDDINGFVAGVDAALPAGWQAGILAGTSHSGYGAPARGSTASSDAYTLGAYGGMAWRGLGLRLGAAYSRYSIDTARHVAFTEFSDTLASSYNASTAQAFGDIGYTIDLRQASLEPFAALAQVNVHSGSFDETGGDAALSAGDTDTDVTFASLGLRAASGFTAADLRWTVSGSAAWRHGWGDLVPAMAMTFDGSDSFTIRGAPIAKDAAALEAGLVMGADGISFGVYYQGQFGDGVTAQGATGRLSFAF